jgi:hypothetical protein
MSDATGKKPDASTAEPVAADPILDEPAASVPSTSVPVATGDTEGQAAAEVAAATPGSSPMAGAQVVYVTAPIPPQPKGNRVVGVLLAVLGAVIFALVYLGVVALLITLFIDPKEPGSAIGEFVNDASFWVPILFFALGFVLIVLLLNRASWWLHVLGSILVAAIVYFGTIGMLLLINNVVVKAPGEVQAQFSDLAVSSVVITAALVAREVSIWVGFLIAVRGRRVAARNLEARAAFDREQAEAKAERERKAAQG